MLVASNSEPILSILLPVYRHEEGVRRILSRLQQVATEECELIIFDDSPEDDIQLIVQNWRVATSVRITYRHNRPANGAAANWNALLDAARGEYCLLLHHDEFPFVDHFVSDILRVLRHDRGLDVLVLGCVLVSPRTGCNRRHLPSWLRSLVVTHFPQYLFQRNVIGPTAALVVRRSLYPRFDVRLQWLVDVDLYVRLLKMAKHLKFCPEIQIGSMLGRADSITAGLGSCIPKLATEERTYLMELRHSTSIWLGPLPNEKISRFILCFGESVCWKLMRGFGRIKAAFCFGPVPRQVARQAIKSPPDP